MPRDREGSGAGRKRTGGEQYNSWNKGKQPLRGTGKAGSGKKPGFKLFYPEQERVNAKVVEGAKGIAENWRTALDIFRPKKK